jgi:hypothetical protein
MAPIFLSTKRITGFLKAGNRKSLALKTAGRSLKKPKPEVKNNLYNINPWT